MRKENTLQRGLTLIEIGLTLTIISIMTAGVFAVFIASKSSRDSKFLVEDVKDISEAVALLFSTEENYGNLSESRLINSGVLSSNYTSGSNIVSYIGEPVLVYPRSEGVNCTASSCNNTYVIEMTNLPNEECSAVSSYYFGRNHFTTFIEDASSGAEIEYTAGSSEHIAACNGTNADKNVKFIFF